MQVTETQTEGLQRQFEIVVPAGDIDSRINSKLAELGQKVNLPGFRPGKVPPAVLKQRYGKSVMGEVLEETVNSCTQQAMNDRGLRPATTPKIEVTSFDEGKDLAYKVDVEIIPEIEPADFSTMEVEKVVVEVSEDDLAETLQRLADRNKKTLPPAEPRPAQKGDVLTVDYAGTVEGIEDQEGLSQEGARIELGAGTLLADFEEQLIGAEEADVREVRITFPDDYPAEPVKGKQAVFQVTVHKIEEQHALAIDDELAKTLGEDSLETLRGSIRQNLEAQYERMAKGLNKRTVLDKLAETHDFPVPAGMVDSEFEAIWQQIEHDREHGHLDPEDKDKSEDDLRTEYRGIAERRVRLGLLLSEVARQNSIDVSQDELNQALGREVQNYPGQEQQVIEYFQNNPDAVANLRAPIFEEKVVDHILAAAQVSEKRMSRQEFQEMTEAEAAKQSQEPPGGEEPEGEGAKD